MEDLYISGTPGMWPVQPVVPPTHYYDIIPLQMDTEGHSSLLVNNQVLSWFGNWKHFSPSATNFSVAPGDLIWNLSDWLFTPTQV